MKKKLASCSAAKHVRNKGKTAVWERLQAHIISRFLLRDCVKHEKLSDKCSQTSQIGFRNIKSKSAIVIHTSRIIGEH